MEEARESRDRHAGHQVWQQLGLNEILQHAGLSDRACLLSEAMTLNRLIFPLSEHAMPDWMRRTALADILGVIFPRCTTMLCTATWTGCTRTASASKTELAEREKTLFHLDDTLYLYESDLDLLRRPSGE